MIEKQQVVEKLGKLFQIAEQNDIHPIFFEYVTLLVFEVFRDESVDYAVIETGLGGLYDSTNIIAKPQVTVITSIDFDH